MFQDVRYGVRMLAQRPGFTLLIVVMLAVGIGANTTIFSALDALTLRPFSFPKQERLVMLHERKLEIGVGRAAVAPGNLADWRTQGRSFEDLVALRTEDFDLRSDGAPGSRGPERYAGYRVSTGFFSALGVEPVLGRTFQAEDGEAGGEQVVVLKHSLWQRRFSSDPDVVGRAINLNGKSFVVIGVMSADFNFPFDGGEMWTPLLIDPAMAEDRGNHYLRVMGLLRPDVSVKQADTEIHELMKRAEDRHPATNSGIDAYVVGLNENYTRGSRTYLPILLGAVAFVLLIACANAANLLLVRGSARQKEMAIRMAVGASRARLIRQLLTESILLALLGAVFGLGLAQWGVMALARAVPVGFSQFIPGWNHLGLNRTVLLFTCGVAIATGALFGLVPAWQATKTEFNEALKEGGKGGGSGRSRWRNGLVVAEITLSVVLLIGAGLLIRSFMTVLQTDFGFDANNTISLRVVLPKDRYAKPDQRINLIQQLLTRVRALPGVRGVGAVDTLPLSGRRNESSFQIVGQPPFPPATQPHSQVSVATPGYFSAVGTPLRSGRLFTDRDTAQAPPVALVNEAFAAKYLAGRTAIGERLLFGGGSPVEIVGVVANVMNEDLDDPAEPGIYQPYDQRDPAAVSLVIRTQADPTAIVGAMTRELAALDPTVPISGVKTLNEMVRERSSPKRIVTVMLTVFALVALTLATVGLYAVTSYAVAQRTRELGIRLALGAQARDIFTMVIRQAMTLTVLGLVLGLAVTLAISRVLAQMLYGVSATDPLTFAVVLALFALVSGLACYVPARRAMKVDPLVALRHE